MEFSPTHYPYYLHYMRTCEVALDIEQPTSLADNELPGFGFVLKEPVRVTLESKHKRRTAKLSPGEFFFIPARVNALLQSGEARAAHLALIRFRCGAVPGSGDAPAFPLPGPAEELQLYRFRLPEARAWIDDFLASGESVPPMLYYRLQSRLYAMAAALLATAAKPVTREDELLDEMERIKRHMLARYNDELDIEAIARDSSCGPNRFYQTFKRHTGLSPYKFVTTTRLNEALRLLSGSAAPVAVVAHTIGYADEFYFSRLFKKHMGLAPSEYAACANKRIVTPPIFLGDLSVLGIAPVTVLRRGWSEEYELHLEAIRRCQPELILASPLTEELTGILSAIAPVVSLPWKTFSWREKLLRISRVLGLETVAERWLAYYDLKVDNARFHIGRQLGEEPYLLVHVRERAYRVYGQQRKKLTDLFYDDLRVAAPPCVRNIGSLDLSALEELAGLGCDNVFFLIPAATSADDCLRLEEEWRWLKRNRRSKRCFFIRHEAPLLYDASTYEGLIDQTIGQLLHTTAR